MRVAALYDIHGNLPALEAVLAEVRRACVVQIVIGGDVFPGPWPNESIALLRNLDVPTQFIMGNGDREVLARMSGEETEWYRTAPDTWREPVRWTAEQLDDEERDFIAAWPATCSLEIPNLGEVLYCHATPRNDTDIFTRMTSDERVLPIFGNRREAVVVCGHTHMQFDRTVGRCRVVNAGSVGMPFGEPGAYWLILESAIEFQRTAYDLAAAADRVRSTQFPQAEEFARKSILQPMSEDEVLGAYAKAEIGGPPG